MTTSARNLGVMWLVRHANGDNYRVPHDHSPSRSRRPGPSTFAVIAARISSSLRSPNIEPTGHSCRSLPRHVRVDHRRLQTVVPEQHLNGPQIDPTLDQV